MYNIFNVKNNDLKTVSGHSFSVSFINFEQTIEFQLECFYLAEHVRFKYNKDI